METACVKHKDISGADKKIDVKNLICSSIDANNNKFWQATLYESGGNWKVHVRWGRVGDNGQEETRTFDDEASARKFIDKKVKEKTGARKGKESYSLAAIVDTDIPLLRPAAGKVDVDLHHHARKIAKNSVTEKLVEYLVKVNVHNIVTGTTMTYNATTGLFSTPLGIVADTAISEARGLLTQIGDFVAGQEALSDGQRQWNDGAYTKLLNQYLRLIPQKVGRKLDPASLYPNLDAVKAQNDILDSLSASLDMASKKPDAPAEQKEEENFFEISLELVSDQGEIERIKTLFRKTLDPTHPSAHLDVANVYSIDIAPVSSAFKKKGEPLGNIMELWHGTRPGNILSIFKKGLVIPPSNASHCTGRMWGDGLYASDQSTKSLNYANPRGWGHSFGNDSVFMFLVNFAMGRVFYPKGTRERLNRKTHDSTWARGELQFPGQGAGVRHSEMIVPNCHQCNLTRLIEFKPGNCPKRTRSW